MRNFRAALWVEAIKARRSKVPWLTAIGFLFVPLVGGLFMVILKDPEAARQMGLISTKAQLTAGSADWPSYFKFLMQAIAVGGAIIFAILPAWVFGREFSDHTAKEVLALPTSRGAIVAAKFVVVAGWAFSVALISFAIGLVVGKLVVIPGWSIELLRSASVNILGSALMAIALLPFVALWASVGRGYLPALGWAILTVMLAQIAAAIGWGDWFPWSVPALFSGVAGPRGELIGLHSYVVVVVACAIGLASTFLWWQMADQAR